MSYILGDDMSDELGNAPGERAFESGMDDNSVNSNASLGQSSARSVDTNGSSHFTLASNAAASSLMESKFDIVRDIRSPITSKIRVSSKKQKYSKQQTLGRNNNSIPPLYSTSMSMSVDRLPAAGNLANYNQYMSSAPAWKPGDDSILAPKSLYKEGAERKIADLKRTFLKKKMTNLFGNVPNCKRENNSSL